MSSKVYYTNYKICKTTQFYHKFQILLIPGNQVCADCDAPDPNWASINLGITLCTQCVGIHRSLGTHISKTRSLSLDVRVWEPEVVKVMAELGNAISNKIYEATSIQGRLGRPLKATKDMDNIKRMVWINAKYVERAFVNKDILKVMSKCNNGPERKSSHIYENWTVRNLRRRRSVRVMNKPKKAGAAELDPNDAEHIFFGSSLNKMCREPTVELDSDQDSLDGILDDDQPALHDNHAAFTPDNLLCKAARAHNLPLMAQALAFGADKDFVSQQNKSSAIHQTILSGSIMACEFLLLNGAKLNVVDSNQGLDYDYEIPPFSFCILTFFKKCSYTNNKSTEHMARRNSI